MKVVQSEVRGVPMTDAAIVNQSAVAGSGVKSNAKHVQATDAVEGGSSAKVHRTFDLRVRVGGWTGIHDYLVLPLLAERAEAAGVEIELEVLDKHWWKGTQYRVHCEGSAENVERLIAIMERNPFILA